jgi:carbon storage regulator CsrA
MLALTRRVGEEIVIGDPRKPLGTIRIVEIHGDKVRLSFDFPRDTQINRKELAELKARQGSETAPGPSGQGGNGPSAPAKSDGSAPASPPANPAPPAIPPDSKS